jgi:hypothetical protein
MREKHKRRFARPGSVEPRVYTRAEIDDAVDWLEELLHGGPIYQKDAVALAEASGISATLLLLAKKHLRVVSVNANDQNPQAVWKLWMWSMRRRQSTVFDNNDNPPWDE